MKSLNTPNLPCQSIWTSKQSVRIDQESIAANPSLALHLMEQAGYWVAIAAMARLKLCQTILVLVGNGNNGGDALVAARVLREKGLDPLVWVISQDPDKLSPSRQIQGQKLKAVSNKLQLYQQGCLQQWQGKPLLIIDGLLGLGLTGPLKPGIYSDCLLEAASLAAEDVIAIDLPSGLDADVWQQPTALLPASCSVTFGAAKPAHLLAPSSASCGAIIIRKIDFNDAIISRILNEIPPHLGYLDSSLSSVEQQLGIWQQLSSVAHKFGRGHVLVIGGSPGKWGAPLLSASAAAAAGAGWVSVAVAGEPTGITPKLALFMTEENWFRQGVLDPQKLTEFILARQVKALVLGPGCMSSPLDQGTLEALQNLIQNHGLFVVIDAGALHDLISKFKKFRLRFQAERCLVTPHPGEWQKMGHNLPAITDLASLQKARQSLLEDYGVSLLYKTATPISPQPLDSQYSAIVSSQSHVGLARAGSGDILAGIVATMGMTGIPAYIGGVMAHQWLVRAAVRASLRKSSHGLLAEDLLIEIQRLTH